MIWTCEKEGHRTKDVEDVPEGRRKRRRPQWRFMDIVEEDMQRVAVTGEVEMEEDDPLG